MTPQQIAERCADVMWPDDKAAQGLGIELVRDRADKSPYAATERLGHRVVLAARQRGVIIRPLGDVIVLMPAPAMPAGLVDELCSATFQAIRDVCGSA